MIKAGFSLLIFFNIVSLCTSQLNANAKTDLEDSLRDAELEIEPVIRSAGSAPRASLTNIDNAITELRTDIRTARQTAEPPQDRQLRLLLDHLPSTTLTAAGLSANDLLLTLRPLLFTIRFQQDELRRLPASPTRIVTSTC